jgi:hypothetical protein
MDRRPPKRVVLSTQGHDYNKALVGTSPYTGDLTYSGLLVPMEWTADQHSRYLFRLAATHVPAGCIGVVKSLRQMLTIGARVPLGTVGEGRSQDEPPFILLEQDVVSPGWCFPDGNVSWHLMRVPITEEITHRSANYYPGLTQEYWLNDTGLLYREAPTDYFVGENYSPPAKGQPPGQPVVSQHLGKFHDVRFPYRDGPSRDLDVRIEGPCIIGFFASVYQADPSLRVVPDYIDPAVQNGLTSLTMLRPEDQFWLTFPNARYHRVGAEMVVDIECGGADGGGQCP